MDLLLCHVCAFSSVLADAGDFQQQRSPDAVLRALLDGLLSTLSRSTSEIESALASVGQLNEVLDRTSGVVALRGCVHLLPLHSPKGSSAADEVRRFHDPLFLASFAFPAF